MKTGGGGREPLQNADRTHLATVLFKQTQVFSIYNHEEEDITPLNHLVCTSLPPYFCLAALFPTPPQMSSVPATPTGE